MTGDPKHKPKTCLSFRYDMRSSKKSIVRQKYQIINNHIQKKKQKKTSHTFFTATVHKLILFRSLSALNEIISNL